MTRPGPKLILDHKLTLAERAVRHRITQRDRHRADLERVLEARSKDEADTIARAALNRMAHMDRRAKAMAAMRARGKPQ